MKAGRDEPAAKAKREIVLWAAALALGLWLIWRGYMRLDVLAIAAGMAAAAAGFALLAGSLARLRLAAKRREPGVVVIDEGRIGLLGPTGGGFVDLSTLVSVSVAGPPGAGERAWVLRGEGGAELVVPFGAVGAEGIPDALAALPGLDLSAAAGREGPIWTAEPVARTPRLP